MFGDVSLEEPDNTAEQPMTLRCTWQETPKVPEVSLDLSPLEVRCMKHYVLPLRRVQRIKKLKPCS